MAKQATTASRRTISPDSPRKKMKDKRRVQLIEANMASIAERGLTETTITHVSEAAGMSRGIINFYFDSKETMMRETLAHLLEEQTGCWQQGLEKAEKSPAREKLEAVLAALFSSKICTKKKLAVWAAFVAHAATHAPYRFQIQQANEKLHAALAEILVQAPVVKPEASQQLLALIDGLWLAQILGDSMRERKDMVALCLALCEPQATMTPAPLAAETGNVTRLPRRAEPRPSAAVEKQVRKPAAKPRMEPEEPPVVADLFALL